MKWMRISQLASEPLVDWLAKYAEYRGNNQRGNRGQQEKQTTQLAVQKAWFFRVAIDGMNTFHDQLHDLRASEKRSGPSYHRPLPRLRRTFNQKLGDYLPASRRQVSREVCNQVEH